MGGFYTLPGCFGGLVTNGQVIYLTRSDGHLAPDTAGPER